MLRYLKYKNCLQIERYVVINLWVALRTELRRGWGGLFKSKHN